MTFGGWKLLGLSEEKEKEQEKEEKKETENQEELSILRTIFSRQTSNREEQRKGTESLSYLYRVVGACFKRAIRLCSEREKEHKRGKPRNNVLSLLTSQCPHFSLSLNDCSIPISFFGSYVSFLCHTGNQLSARNLFVDEKNAVRKKEIVEHGERERQKLGERLNEKRRDGEKVWFSKIMERNNRACEGAVLGAKALAEHEGMENQQESEKERRDASTLFHQSISHGCGDIEIHFQEARLGAARLFPPSLSNEDTREIKREINGEKVMHTLVHILSRCHSYVPALRLLSRLSAVSCSSSSSPSQFTTGPQPDNQSLSQATSPPRSSLSSSSSSTLSSSFLESFKRTFHAVECAVFAIQQKMHRLSEEVEQQPSFFCVRDQHGKQKVTGKHIFQPKHGVIGHPLISLMEIGKLMVSHTAYEYGLALECCATRRRFRKKAKEVFLPTSSSQRSSHKKQSETVTKTTRETKGEKVIYHTREKGHNEDSTSFATIAKGKSQSQRAEALYRVAINYDERNVRALLRMAEICEREGKLTLSRTLLEKMLRFISVSSSSPKSTLLVALSGWELMSRVILRNLLVKVQKGQDILAIHWYDFSLISLSAFFCC